MNEHDAADIEKLLETLPEHPGETLPIACYQIPATAVHILNMVSSAPAILIPQAAAEQSLRVAILLSLHAPDWWRQFAEAIDEMQDPSIVPSVLAGSLAQAIDELAAKLQATVTNRAAHE